MHTEMALLGGNGMKKATEGRENMLLFMKIYSEEKQGRKPHSLIFRV